MFELLRVCTDRSAVIGVGNFPENCIGIAGVDALRVAKGNVAVDLAVNEEDRDWCGRD